MDKSKEFIFLKNLIENKNAYIGIIGLGYVGLPLAMTFAESEFNVLGIDIDKKKVASLNAYKSYINHIPDKKIEKLVKSKKLQAISNFEKVSELDVVLVSRPNLDEYDNMDKWELIALPTKDIEDPKTPGYCYANVPKRIWSKYIGHTKEVLEEVYESVCSR